MNDSTRWNPTDVMALAPWLKARRTAETPAEYACAVQRPLPISPTAGESAAGAVLAIVGGIVAAAMLVHWWSA
jgi:hypothetical protein